MPIDNLLDVKTEDAPLPHLFRARGRWYFRRCGIHVAIKESYGSDEFFARYGELLLLTTPRREDKRPVYFVGWEAGPIKIGVGTTPKNRLTTLQIGCPYKLHILAVAQGGEAQEKAYHRRYKAHWMRGEWFERVPEIEAEIERLAPNPGGDTSSGGFVG